MHLNRSGISSRESNPVVCYRIPCISARYDRVIPCPGVLLVRYLHTFMYPVRPFVTVYIALCAGPRCLITLESCFRFYYTSTIQFNKLLCSHQLISHSLLALTVCQCVLSSPFNGSSYLFQIYFFHNSFTKTKTPGCLVLGSF